MQSFVTAEPHSTAIRKFAERAGEGAAFVDWDNTDGKKTGGRPIAG